MTQYFWSEGKLSFPPRISVSYTHTVYVHVFRKISIFLHNSLSGLLFLMLLISMIFSSPIVYVPFPVEVHQKSDDSEWYSERSSVQREEPIVRFVSGVSSRAYFSCPFAIFERHDSALAFYHPTLKYNTYRSCGLCPSPTYMDTFFLGLLSLHSCPITIYQYSYSLSLLLFVAATAASPPLK